MTSNAKWGANSPLPSEGEEPDTVPGSDSPFRFQDDTNERKQTARREHDPDAKALLNRHLSALQSGKQNLGNSALHDLESRLTALCEKDRAETSAKAASEPAEDRAESPASKKTRLKDRLHELSQYLNEDLTRLEASKAQKVEPEQEATAPVLAGGGLPEHPVEKDEGAVFRHSHKPLSAPILDRAWFEDRFAAMRSSIDEIAQQVPDRRVERLGDQFNQLMEKLDAIQADRSHEAVKSGLKQLANYLEENRNWTVSHDTRIKELEDRLDHLNRLVSQSNAALSSAVKGLEIVARGTGPALANKTADLVTERLESRLSNLATGEKVNHLSGEVSKMMLQSEQFARKTDDRLKMMQTSLDDGLHKMEEIGVSADDAKAAKSWNEEIDADTYQPPYSEKLSAAQRAAQFAAEHNRELPEDGEPIRHQIPYGEFLPEDERSNSHMGLVIAAIILLLAGAAMLYLNLKDSGAARLLSNTRKADNLIMPVTADAEQPVRIVLTKADPIVTRAGNDAAPLTMHHTVPNAEIIPSVAAKPDEDGNERQAAILGDTAAQYSIAASYLRGVRNETREAAAERLSLAARWFRRAAESGHVAAQYRLATLYELGHGVSQNYAEAMKWYERAAIGGHIKAMHNLGVLTASMMTGQADYTRAAYWFAQAAERGLKDSQYNLALLYEHGLGVKKNLRGALRWYSAAALQGDAKAAEKWNKLLRILSDNGHANVIIAPKDTKWSTVTTGIAGAANDERMPVRAKPVPDAVWKQPAQKTDRNIGGWSAQLTSVNDTVVKAQQLLNRLGFKPGKADGILGPRTMAAIRAYQKKAGIPQTGSLSDRLMNRMEAELAS